MKAIDNPEITQICQIQDYPKGFGFPTVSKERSVVQGKAPSTARQNIRLM
jgi:hypothetical protein